MIATIAIIAVFQAYWLNRLYQDEKQGLKKETDVLFRESIYNLQLQKFRNDTLLSQMFPQNKFLMDAMSVLRRSATGPLAGKMVFTMSNSVSKTKDSDGKVVPVPATPPDEKSITVMRDKGTGEFGRVIFRSSLGDSLSVPQIDSAYRKDLRKARIRVAFSILSQPVKGDPRLFNDSVSQKLMRTNFVVVGLAHPVAYQAQLGNPFNHILGKITYPILISVLLIALTTVSFVFLYRNLVAQQRLTAIKNDFISNITHELKTPIATVNVAIEALKRFNAMDNPERTREYLDISSSELQRLSLLVDKVLKLSLFESQGVELRKERFDLALLAEEVMRSLQLQVRNRKATIELVREGNDFNIVADKLHITSVVYNLVDNALKYSPEQPEVKIRLSEKRNSVELKVTDRGIGIPAAYKEKIFDKFFRVPHGDTHDIKGYGLGLSYAHHVIERHGGSIEVESEEGQGSSFTVHLLKEA